MPGRRMRLSVGDVFQLPLDLSRVGYGQIVGVYYRTAYYFAIFEQPHEYGEQPELAKIVRGRIALFALSLDALLYHGGWEIVGNTSAPEIDWPTYKEAVAPDVFETFDHTGSIRRPATSEEVESLRYRAVVAPIRLQNAFRALHGAAEWNEAYDELRYR
jgi:Immunity protein 26